MHQSRLSNGAQHQVRLMFEVYTLATKVWCWLGAGNLGSDWLFEQFSLPAFWSNNPNLDIARGQIPPTKIILATKYLNDMVLREYWDRLWVVQEIFMAKEILVCCGDHETKWQHLTKFISQGNEFLHLYAWTLPLKVKRDPMRAFEACRQGAQDV